MAATLKDLIEEVQAYLLGFTGDVEQTTSLTSPITASSVELLVDDPLEISRGLVEIDSELIRVQAVNTSTSTATVPSWGRGQQGSVAVAHGAGARVTNAPRFPRHRIKTVINEVILGLYPQLFGVVEDDSLTAVSAQVAYPLPAKTRSVVSVAFQMVGPTRAWYPLTRYRLDMNANTTAFSTGASLDILQPMTPGQRIKVIVRTELSELTNDSDPLTSSGLQESARDVVVWGALAQLVPAAEFGRLQSTTVEQSDRGRLVQPGAASAASRQALQMFALRLEQERNRLHALYPTTAHLTR